VTAASVPRLAPKARLREDNVRKQTLLLYPERALALNASAAAIVRACGSGRTVAEIAESLAAPLDDVVRFLDDLAERGLVRV
jgi:pyrroloquinoline quinone biosynthesis protein D